MKVNLAFMLRKYLDYILKTCLCHFNKSFYLQQAKVKWIRYSIDKENVVRIEDSRITKCGFSINGKNNKITCLNLANMNFSGFNIVGNNNVLVLDGCSGILNLTLRGDNNYIHIGKNTVMEDIYMVCMGVSNQIQIGENCMISGNVEIWNTDSHLITDLSGKPLNQSLPVTIGNHVWIGKHVKILKGVHIGDGSIVGMSSVVTKDIPNHAIAAGNPARVVKENCKWKHSFIQI